MITKKGIPDKYFYIPIVLFVAALIYRLFDQSKILNVFPLDYTNDVSAYMAILFFLKECGFHNFCPYWYNGFITFQLSNPGWYFFVYPIYLITNNVLQATFISLILQFIFGLAIVIYLGRLIGLSLIKCLFFFFVLFANAVAIGNFIRLGRLHEFFAWLNFLFLGFAIFFYKDKRIDWKFLLLTIPTSLTILGHSSVAILAMLTFIPILLIKRRFKERLIISLTLVFSFILTSFWWIDFVKNFIVSAGPIGFVLTETLIVKSPQGFIRNLPTLIVPILLFAAFYFYSKSYQIKRKELIFWSPILIMALLLFFRAIFFIPVLRYVFPDNYVFYLLFFSILIFLKIDFDYISRFKWIVFYGLIIISLISLMFTLFYTPDFVEYTDLERNTLKVLEKVDDVFLIFGSPSTTSYPKAYFSYAPIYLNLSTSSGWDVVPSERRRKLLIAAEENLGKDCSPLQDILNELDTKQIITYDEHCSFLKQCNFDLEYSEDNVCLYGVPL